VQGRRAESTFDTRTKLESALCDATNMAFMLEATLETNGEFYDERKDEAIAFGIYEVAERIRMAKEIYYKHHDKIREVTSDKADATFTDEDAATKKVVSLH
jgi:hypothetical protein